MAIDPHYTLLNGHELAEALNVDARFVTAMKHHGTEPFQFNRGGRTTLALAHAWLAANPTFAGIQRRRKSALAQ